MATTTYSEHGQSQTQVRKKTKEMKIVSNDPSRKYTSRFSDCSLQYESSMIISSSITVDTPSPP